MTNDKLNELRIELHKEVDARIDKFMEPQFEVGKWYKLDSHLYYLTKIITDSRNPHLSYGINAKGLWSEETGRCLDDFKEATELEVLEALKVYSKTKYNCDFEIGTKIKGHWRSEIKEVTSKKGFYYLGSEDKVKNIYFGVNGVWLLYNGKWAEVIKEKTSDDYANEFFHNFNGTLLEYLSKNNLQITKKP